MKDLSIIIVSYNTREITVECLHKLLESLRNEKSLSVQVIIIDNDSSDDSQSAITEFIEQVPKTIKRITFRLIKNKENIGYGKANNQGIRIANSKYTLLLNSDAFIKQVDFEALLDYLDQNPTIGLLTVKVVLPSGKVDPASHRGFPTPWRSFTYFSGLEKTFKHIPVLSKIFGGYHLTHLSLDTTHEIDSPTGAFYLARTSLLQKLKGFDPIFFMYGEDLDLSYRIKEAGYKVLYYPKYEVLHFKHQSGIKKKNPEIAARTKAHFYGAMKIFYDKHYKNSYPAFFGDLVHKAIDMKANL